MLLGKRLTSKDFIEIDANLNCFVWDDRVGAKPTGFDDMTLDEQYFLIKPIRSELSLLVSKYDSLKYWNTKLRTDDRRMTESEFDGWFSQTFNLRSRKDQTDNISEILCDKSSEESNYSYPNSKITILLFVFILLQILLLLIFIFS